MIAAIGLFSDGAIHQLGARYKGLSLTRKNLKRKFMYNISLIFTTHKEYGNCNSMELQRIIKKINPEIIFEELSYSNYDKSYNQQTLVTLETNAIKNYLQNHEVKHIPVDTYALPTTYDEDISRMYKKLFHSNQMMDSYHLRCSVDNHSLLMYENGFEYLNSNQEVKFIEEFKNLKEKILNAINDENLFRLYSLEKEMIEKREHEIISNIYKYSAENVYHQALLFIGSGHRKSIIEMIKKIEMHEKVKLNWTSYSN